MGEVVEKMGVVVEEHSWGLSHSGSYEAAMEALSSLITRQKRGDKSVALRGKYSKLERMMMYIKVSSSAQCHIFEVDYLGQKQ